MNLRVANIHAFGECVPQAHDLCTDIPADIQRIGQCLIEIPTIVDRERTVSPWYFDRINIPRRGIELIRVRDITPKIRGIDSVIREKISHANTALALIT